MRSITRLAAITALACLVGLRTTTAQSPAGLTPSAGGLPIEISAKPSKIQPGGTVILKGTSAPASKSASVTILVARAAGGPPIRLTAAIGVDGSFSTPFAQTTTSGLYQVEATASDGKGRATTSFRVVTAAEIPAAITDDAQKLVTAVDKALDAARSGLAAQPLSPAKQQAETRLANAEAELAKAPAQIALLKQHMTRVFEARAKVSEPLPDWDDYIGKLETWQEDAQTQRARLERQAAATEAGSKACAQLDAYYEILTAASDALKLAKAPLDLSLGFWKSKSIDAIANRTTDPRDMSKGEKFAYVQAMKLGVAALQGPSGVMAAIPGFILDAARYLHQEMFAQYCEKFEGPAEGVFVGESFTHSGELFIAYTIAIDGKMVLMHSKSAPANKPIAVEGYVEGNGRFNVRDNPNVIGRLIPGTALFHKVVSPPGFPYWNDVGQGLKSLHPNYFRVPLHGTMVGDSIMLKVPLEPAISDFGESIKGRTIWVAIPLGGMIPEIIDSPVALQKAHPIIERVVRRHPVLTLRTESGFVIAQGKFARDTTNADRTAHVTTTLTLKACRPQCVPSGLYKGAP